MAGAVLERVLRDEALQVIRQGAGQGGRAPGAGPVGEALHPLRGKAMDPFPQGGIGKVECVRDRLEPLAFHDLAYGLRPTEDPGFLGLFEHDI
jgi:hypothetical protein